MTHAKVFSIFKSKGSFQLETFYLLGMACQAFSFLREKRAQTGTPDPACWPNTYHGSANTS